MAIDRSSDEAPFPYGVASFEPTATSVLLWTNTGGGDPLRWVLARDPNLADVVASGLAARDLDGAGSVSVDVTGLEPATTYHYGFTGGGTRSPVGRTRTLPQGPADRLRLGLVCCAKYAAVPLGVYRALAEREVDLVVHLGDYVYEDGEAGERTPEPPHPTVTLEDYRARYAQTRADPDVRALHQRHPMVAVWDDHDLADNAWHGGAKGHDPKTQGPWEDRVAAAARARAEWVPVRSTGGETDPARQWRAIALGDLAELVLLDTRYPGRDQHADAEGAKDLHDPSRSLLGEQQRAWAHERVADRSRTWTLLTSQVVVSEMHLPVAGRRTLGRALPAGYTVVDGHAICTDEWDGYPAERDALTAAIRRRGGGVVVLSGDVHSSWAFVGPCDADGPVAVELTCPATSSAPMGRTLPVGGRFVERLLDDFHHVRWVEIESHGYVIVDVTSERVQGEWWFVDPYDPDAGSRFAAGWRTEPGLPPVLEAVDEPSDDPSSSGAAPDPSTGDPTAGVALPPRPDGVVRRRHRGRRLAGRALVGVASLLALRWAWARLGADRT